MKTLSTGTLSFALVALAGAVLIAIGSPGSRVAPLPPPPPAPPPPGVSAGGFTLASTAIELPVDEQRFPDGPHADVVNANCTACHSASMTLNQPQFTPEQWKATVIKMREVYNAPIADGDVPAILSYLGATKG